MLAERRHPLVGRIVPLDPRFTPRVSAADFSHTLFLMSDVFSRGSRDSQPTLTLAVFAQLRKYATIA